MTARSPPARPPIGVYPSSVFETGDWGEDDAWDSGSDSESPRQSTLAMSWTRPSKTAPKPVPKPTNNTSSSTLALSFTHINAPNSSSYPPRQEAPTQNGWTMVQKAPVRSDNTNGLSSLSSTAEPEGQGDVDDTMIVGELDAEDQMSAFSSPSTKSMPDKGSIRPDAADILNGRFNSIVYCNS